MYEAEGTTLPVVETLPNQIVLVNDYLPGRVNASISVEIFRGSRDEPNELAGGHHFNEHLLFRGCKQYPSYQSIYNAIEDNGGAFLGITGREATRFKINVPAEKLLVAADVLAAMLTDPILSPGDIENVRKVILEEIAEYHDHAPEWIGYYAPTVVWGNQHPLGHPICGTSVSVANLTKNGLIQILEESCVGNAMAIVVSGGGRLDYEAAHQRFGGIPTRTLSPRTAPEWNQRRRSKFDTRSTLEKSYWAAQLPGIAANDPDKTAYYIMSEVLQERLDRTVRERDGFTYGIETDFEALQDSGTFTIQSSSEEGSVGPAIAGSISEIIRLAEGGPTERELFRQQMRHHGNLLRYIETPNGLNNHWAEQLIAGRRNFLTPMQVDSQVMATTLEEVHRQAKRLTSGLKDLRLLAVNRRRIGASLTHAARRAVADVDIHEVT